MKQQKGSHYKRCYSQFRFEDSLRKYQSHPHKKIKCSNCNCISNCSHQKDNKIKYNQRITLLISARQSYIKSNEKPFKPHKRINSLNISQISQFTQNNPQKYKKDTKITIDINSAAVSQSYLNNNMFSSITIHNEYNNQQPIQKLSLDKKYNKSTHQQQQPISIVEPCIEQPSIQQQSILQQIQIYQIVEPIKNQLHQEQQVKSSQRLQKEQNKQLLTQVIKQQVGKQQVEKQEVEKQQIAKITSEEIGQQIDDKERVDRKINQHNQNYDVSQMYDSGFVSQKEQTRRYMKRKINPLPIQIINGHMKIISQKTQCLLSVRVFNKLIKPLSQIDNMVEAIIKKRPYLEDARQTIKQAILHHLDIIQ